MAKACSNMEKISVVIVCKNEAHIIGRTLQAVRAFAGEVLVYDTGSQDNTVAIAQHAGARVVQGPWEGYGRSKQAAVKLASHDWVLNLDADEVPDEKLQLELSRLMPTSSHVVYRMRFKNFLGDAYLRWGEWGHDYHVRLFNRKTINWNTADIHETLIIPPGTQVINVPGSIHHYTARDLQEYSQKTVRYAMLIAEKYASAGKRARWYHLYLSPAFSFVKHYVFQLGFLDGWRGLASARMSAFYTFIKYARLREMQSRHRAA